LAVLRWLITLTLVLSLLRWLGRIITLNKQEAGLAALEKLDAGLVEFQALIDAKDKQAVPVKQREVLEYVGQVEAAMVKGFPFEVPKEYADRPLLKVGGCACVWGRGGVRTGCVDTGVAIRVCKVIKSKQGASRHMFEWVCGGYQLVTRLPPLRLV
jgi:hypothetical protein